MSLARDTLLEIEESILRRDFDKLSDAIDEYEEKIATLERDLAAAKEQLSSLQGTDDHPEHKCSRCGGRNIWSWYADSTLWNAVVRSALVACLDGVVREPILCPICFTQLAKERGVYDGTWRLCRDDYGPALDDERVRHHAALEELAAEREAHSDTELAFKHAEDIIEKYEADVERLTRERDVACVEASNYSLRVERLVEAALDPVVDARNQDWD